jgi:modulator of FtsH protease
MEPLATPGWSDFFVAAAGAAAALAGLVFVSISINLEKIIAAPGIVGRAAETIILLSGTLAVCLIALIPHLSAPQLGAALLAASTLKWIVCVLIQFQTFRARTYYRRPLAVLRALLLQVATLPAIWGALALRGVVSGGIGEIAAAVILSILVAMFNAWVLLIEILR